jgi:hypothetical protein
MKIMPKVAFVDVDEAKAEKEEEYIPPKSEPMAIPERRKKIVPEPIVEKEPIISDEEELSEELEEELIRGYRPRRVIKKKSRTKKGGRDWMKISFIGAMVAASIYLLKG